MSPINTSAIMFVAGINAVEPLKPTSCERNACKQWFNQPTKRFRISNSHRSGTGFHIPGMPKLRVTCANLSRALGEEPRKPHEGPGHGRVLPKPSQYDTRMKRESLHVAAICPTFAHTDTSVTRSTMHQLLGLCAWLGIHDAHFLLRC